MLNNRKMQHYIDLIVVLTQKEMKVRYKSSFLGYFWSIALPLAFAFVYFVAFKIVMRVEMENYSLFLIAGLFPWQSFSNSISLSPTVFLNNGSIIKKINFPRNVTLIASIFQDMLHFLLSIPVIISFVFLYGKWPSLSWLYGIPVLMFIQFLITYGMCLILSSVNLFFRDLERLTMVLMTFMFYFTPIIYNETMIPEKYRPLISLNPLGPLMISWRNLFLYGTLKWEYLVISFIYGIIALIAGLFVYRKLSWKFAEVI